MKFKFKPPKLGSISNYSNFDGSGDAYILAKIAQQERPIVIIASSALEAQRLLEEIPFFSPGLKVHLLPDWETLPYDNLSPHHDLISERLATLYQVMNSSCDVLIVPVTTALYRMSPREYLAAYTFFIKRGEVFELELFLSQMTLAGYAHVSQVISPGEYSVRGGLIDLFPMGSSLPYRVDRMDKEIETIKTFDVDTQRSIYPVMRFDYYRHVSFHLMRMAVHVSGEIFVRDLREIQQSAVFIKMLVKESSLQGLNIISHYFLRRRQRYLITSQSLCCYVCITTFIQR